MANNRMIIKCKVCSAEKIIAKYYPSAGWCLVSFPKKAMMQLSPGDFQEFMDEHSHNFDARIGPTHFELMFESVPSD